MNILKELKLSHTEKHSKPYQSNKSTVNRAEYYANPVEWKCCHPGQSFGMAHTERLWPMKVAIRCLQVLSALLLITYAFTFYKFVDKSSIRYWYNDTKAEEGIVSEIPMKPLQRTIPVKDKIPEWLR